MIEAAALLEIVKLVGKFLPSGISIFNDIRDLFKKYPGLTPEQFVALTQLMASTADSTYDQVIDNIKTDQSAHK